MKRAVVWRTGDLDSADAGGLEIVELLPHARQLLSPVKNTA
eukprot:COSAG04_NODE_2474_length_4061_cov_26.333173_4_plen_41_part_00